MSIKVNKSNKSTANHYFSDYCAFIDEEGDFYLIAEDSTFISRITHSGCVTYNIEHYETIEEFLDCEFGDCKVEKVYRNGNEYEIIVNG